VQTLIICGWKDRDGIEGFIMLHKRRVADEFRRGLNRGKRRGRNRKKRGRKKERETEKTEREKGEGEREKETTTTRVEEERSERFESKRGR